MLPSSLWFGVVVPDMIQSMSQIKQTVCKQMTDVKLELLCTNNWIFLSRCKKESSGSFKNVIYKMCS